MFWGCGFFFGKIALAEFYVIEDKNLTKGRNLLIPIAKDGNASAQVHLAQTYLGRGSAESDAQGIKWLRSAAGYR